MPAYRLDMAATLALVAILAACGAAQRSAPPEPPVDCQYTTMRPRFCGVAEDEAIWRETHTEQVRVCNGCFTDDQCRERPGGSCVELPGEGCAYSAFVCVYPGDPCADSGADCDGTCQNREGRAVCASAGIGPEGE